MKLVWSPEDKTFLQKGSKVSDAYHISGVSSMDTEKNSKRDAFGWDRIYKSRIFSQVLVKSRDRLKKWVRKKAISLPPKKGTWKNVNREEKLNNDRFKNTIIADLIKKQAMNDEVEDNYISTKEPIRIRRRFRFAPYFQKGDRSLDRSLLKEINWQAVTWGWFVSLLVTTLVIGAAAFYVAMTPGSVFYLGSYLMLNKAISPLIGGIVAGLKAKYKGWQMGFWVGAGYGLVVMIFKLYAGLINILWLDVVTGLGAAILSGMVGGLLGQVLFPYRYTSESALKGYPPDQQLI